MLNHKLNLSNVTYCCIDGRVDKTVIQSIIANAEFAADHIEFSRIIVLTPSINHVEHKLIRFIDIDPINSIEEYNIFCLNKLYKFIHSKFCMIFQWDGCISNPHLWDETFLNFDYIGAPWPCSEKWLGKYKTNDAGIVGNGGFSLRSLRLLYECNRFKNIKCNEDIAISLIFRKILIDRGLKFADLETGKQFSVEIPVGSNHKFETSFGFHNRTNLQKFICKLKSR